MTQERIVKEHFHQMGQDGSYAEFYGESRSASTHDFIARRDRVQEFLIPRLRPGHSVLDIGCGTGPMVDFFGTHGLVYHGLDVAQGMLDSIQQQFQHKPYWHSMHLQIGSCTDLPYKQVSFDFIVAMGLLEYLDNMQPALDQIARVTKAGGIAVMTIPNRHCLNRWIMRHSGFVTGVYQSARKMLKAEVPKPQGIFHRELAPAELDRLMKDVGFDCIGRAFYDYKLVFYPLSRLFPNFAYRVNRHVENRGPAFLANGYIGFYRKGAR